MASRSWVDKIKTSYRNFYRPMYIDVAIRRREILAILYAVSALGFCVSVTKDAYHMRDVLDQVKPDTGKGSITLRYVNGELISVVLN